MNRKKRLLKLVAASGLFPTRTAAEKAIHNKEVLVDGTANTNPQFQLDPKKHKITTHGKTIRENKEKLYFAFNKPTGVTCEKNEVSNVYQMLRHLKLAPEITSTLSCSGRLDKDTTGLLIFTNDGEFNHTLLSPTKKIKKIYEAEVHGIPTKEEISRLQKGVVIPLDEGKTHQTAPCTVKLLNQTQSTSTLQITLQEGKKRQIRKMLDVIRHPVISLKRTAIGKLSLGDLPRGRFKPITPEDIFGTTPKKKEQDFKNKPVSLQSDWD